MYLCIMKLFSADTLQDWVFSLKRKQMTHEVTAPPLNLLFPPFFVVWKQKVCNKATLIEGFGKHKKE